MKQTLLIWTAASLLTGEDLRFRTCFRSKHCNPPRVSEQEGGAGWRPGGVKRCSWGPRGCRQRRVLPARFLRVCMCVCVRAHAWLLPPGHSRPPGVPHPSWRVGEGDGHQRGDLGLTAPHAHGGAAPVVQAAKRGSSFSTWFPIRLAFHMKLRPRLGVYLRGSCGFHMPALIVFLMSASA